MRGFPRARISATAIRRATLGDVAVVRIDHEVRRSRRRPPARAAAPRAARDARRGVEPCEQRPVGRVAEAREPGGAGRRAQVDAQPARAQQPCDRPAARSRRRRARRPRAFRRRASITSRSSSRKRASPSRAKISATVRPAGARPRHRNRRKGSPELRAPARGPASTCRRPSSRPARSAPELSARAPSIESNRGGAAAPPRSDRPRLPLRSGASRARRRRRRRAPQFAAAGSAPRAASRRSGAPCARR